MSKPPIWKVGEDYKDRPTIQCPDCNEPFALNLNFDPGYYFRYPPTLLIQHSGSEGIKSVIVKCPNCSYIRYVG